MKPATISLGTALLIGLFCSVSYGQRSASRWTNNDAVSTYRIGTQGVNFTELNQALQQAGYGSLPGQVTMLSVASQVSRMNRPLAFHSEFGVSFPSKVTNGSNKASAGFYYIKFGASYRIINSGKFQLAPQLSLLSLPFHVRVDKIGASTPPLSTVLTNPGSVQTATLRTPTGGIDAGLTAGLRVPYGQQRQLDCSTFERSFVIGLDVGYRFSGRAPLDTRHEVSANNPAVQLSGWYAGLRLGFGNRVRSTASPVTP